MNGSGTGTQDARAAVASRPTDRPSIGVVVVTYNGLSRTLECIEALRAVGYPERKIVVVDNASSDGTPAALAREFPEVPLLPQEENLGFTGGSNVGIRWALEHGCDAVLLLNSDARLHPMSLDVMAARLAPASIVAPEIRSSEGSQRVLDDISFFDWRRGIASALPPARPAPAGLPNRIASGCCLLVEREVFDRIGLLDEKFFLYFEDVDFIVRAQAAGCVLIREPNAVVYHPEEAASERPSALKIYYNTRNRLYLMHKYARATPRFMAHFLATRAVYAVRYILGGQRASLLAMLRGVRDFRAGRLGRAEYQW